MSHSELHSSAIVCDAHQEILDEYVYQFLLHEEKAVRGEIHIFDQVYQPLLEKQGVNLVNMAVGGDHVAQIMYSNSEYRFWDAHKSLIYSIVSWKQGVNLFFSVEQQRILTLPFLRIRLGFSQPLMAAEPYTANQT